MEMRVQMSGMVARGGASICSEKNKKIRHSGCKILLSGSYITTFFFTSFVEINLRLFVLHEHF